MARRVAYLGPPGTFSEEALLGEGRLGPIEPVEAATIGEAIAWAAQGEVDAAFVPIENSIEGSVNATLDDLVFNADLFIQAEVIFDVHLNLVARPGARLDEIREVLSYPVATAQCRNFLAAQLGKATVGATTSTAEAARFAAESGRNDLAAVSPSLAARLYGLDILAPGIEDYEDNKTRFVLVAANGVPAPTGIDKTTIVCFQHDDRPGSLHQIIGQFAARAINLTRIESRPTKKSFGDYCFVIDLEGHIGDEVVGACLAELHSELGRVKFLGSYPAYSRTAEARSGLERERDQARAWLASLRSQIAR